MLVCVALPLSGRVPPPMFVQVALQGRPQWPTNVGQGQRPIMAFVLLTGIGDLLGIPKRLSVGIEQAINRVHVPAGVERFGVKRLKQRIALLVNLFARAFALEQPVVASAGVDGVWAQPAVAASHARLRASPLP